MGIAESLKEIEVKNNNSIQVKNFFIGGGSIIFNFFISLDAVAVVRLGRVQDISIASFIMLAIIVVIILLIPIDLAKIIGIVLVVACILCIYLINRKNKKKIYTLQVKLCNGEQFLFKHRTAYVNKKDKAGLKGHLLNIGKQAINEIFIAGVKSSVKAVAVPIVRKVLGI